MLESGRVSSMPGALVEAAGAAVIGPAVLLVGAGGAEGAVVPVPPDDPTEEDPPEDDGAVGVAVPGIEVAVVSTVDGTEVVSSTPVELVVRPD